MNITTGKGDIRVAIVGVGNCANSLVQGVTYYKDAALDQEIPGLMHATIGSYHISNVKFVAAFDVDAKKVGLDLADAIWKPFLDNFKNQHQGIWCWYRINFLCVCCCDGCNI